MNAFIFSQVLIQDEAINDMLDDLEELSCPDEVNVYNNYSFIIKCANLVAYEVSQISFESRWLKLHE